MSAESVAVVGTAVLTSVLLNFVWLGTQVRDYAASNRCAKAAWVYECERVYLPKRPEPKEYDPGTVLPPPEL